MSERVEFLGFHFDSLSLSKAITTFMASPPDAPFRYVVTPNVDHVVRYHREVGLPDVIALNTAYDRAEWCFCDSRILSLLAGRAGVAMDVVPGSDLTAALLQASVVGDRICIIGGDDDTQAQLEQIYPGRHFSQFQPPMGLRSNPEAIAAAVAFVNGAEARYVFLAVGSPQQEMLAHKILEGGQATGLGFCVGASIDFLTGKAKRAPSWVRNMRLEWAHRLASNPARLWRRYLIDGPQIFVLYRRWRQGRRSDQTMG